MRNNTGLLILAIVVALMLLGVFSLGEVLGFIFYIFIGIILLGTVLMIAFRLKLNRIRRQMSSQQGDSTYGDARRGTHERHREGEVTVRQTSSSTSTKIVNNEVGSYVEYEEFTEEISEE